MVGTDHDTGAFAVASIRGWWRFEGRRIYPDAHTILITGRRGRKQRLAVAVVEVGVAEIFRSDRTVHFGLSFSSRHQQMEQDRAPAVFLHFVQLARAAVAGLRNGRPSHHPDNYNKGLTVTCRLDRRRYPTGLEVSNAEMARVNLERNKFHGEWNYVIKPNVSTS